MAKISRHFENKITGLSLDAYRDSVETVRKGLSHFKGRVKTPVQTLLGYLDAGKPHHLDGRSRQKSSFSVRETLLAEQFLLKSPDEMYRYLNYRYLFNESSKQLLLTDFPVVLALEVTSVCNLRCTMCYQSDNSFRSDRSFMGFMDFELYKKIIDEAAEEQLCSLVLAARGEPTLHPKIIEMIRYAKEKGILEIKMNTNATKLTPKLSQEILESGLDILVFSVDSYVKDRYEKIRRNANFDQVLANITQFNALRKQTDSPLKTRISMLLIDPLDKAEEAETFWSPLVDEFAIGRVMPVTDIYHFDKVEDATPCAHLWERMYVWQDGKVNPCEQDYKSTLSRWNANDRPLKDIWKDSQYMKYREIHTKGQKNTMFPCDRCDGV